MFVNPLGLLALLAIPAVIGLHLFRRRFRERSVSAVFLWAPKDRSSHAGRKRAPLHTSASFWLELLAALLLGLAFAGPRACGVGMADHLVVVLDGSGSMSAVEEEALDVVQKRVRLLARRDRVTVVVSGPAPEVVVGPAALKTEVSLEGYAPVQAGHDLGPAMDLATELAAGGPVLLVTDRFEGEAERWPPGVELVAVGEPLDNLGITQASRVRMGEDDEVYVGVGSAARRTLQARLVLLDGEQELAAEALSLEPGEQRSLSWRVPRDTLVELRLEVEDGLELDDGALLAPLPPRTLGLHNALSPELTRQLRLERWARVVPDSVEVDAARAHLVISEDGVSGGPAAWSLVLGGGEEPGDSLLGPFLLQKQHPLLDGVSLDGVIWTRSGRELAGSPLVSAGNQPLLTEELVEGRRRFSLDLDPWASTLHRSPDWPILLLNLAELRRRQLPGPRGTNLVVGEELVYMDAEPGAWSIDGRPLAGTDTLVVPGLRPGLHRLERDGQLASTIAVRFLDASESSLLDRSSGHRDSEASASLLRADLSSADTLLVLLALLALVLDWWVLKREAGGLG